MADKDNARNHALALAKLGASLLVKTVARKLAPEDLPRGDPYVSTGFNAPLPSSHSTAVHCKEDERPVCV